ncbi:MAG: molybdopterin-synthase adenylyltransferase MoeB [Bryobacteraceae bacterium]|nr:molybdopterin-synthase adenylyltransferase MoeB [Bryobacteraceae bacterium]
MAKVLIPTPLRQYADKKDSVEVGGATVGEVLTTLTTQFGDLRKQLYNDEGKLRSFVNVYLNDEDIRYLSKDSTPVKDSDVVSIVPSIAGGSTLAAAEPATLSKEEIQRYSRHLIMPEVGMDGQLKLKQAKVLLVGTGGLGAPLGLYLAAAGVGRIGLVDFDVVDYSNLQRQVIHGTKDVGRKKLDSAADRMSDINPHIEIVKHEVALTSENAIEIIREYDLVVDGTDNFPTRYLVNDACVLLGKPNVYGSIFRFEGQASVFATENGPCYRCLYPEPPPPGLVPSCAEGGVLGILPGLIGVVQATEAVKLILGSGDSLIGRLLLYDALGMKFRELKLRKNPECPICGEHRTITGLIDYQEFCGIPAQPAAAESAVEFEITPVEVKARQDRGDDFQFIDVREPHEYQICSIPGAKLIPLGDLPQRVQELDMTRDLVAHCKSGVRSGKAIDFLKQAGFRKVKNMKGGILAWSDQVDPSVPKY